MQGLPNPNPTPATKDEEVSIPPTENVSDAPNLNTVIKHRKAAKRTLPWDLPADELELVSPPPPPPPPQDEDIRTRKKPRLAEPFSASKDEDVTMLSGCLWFNDVTSPGFPTFPIVGKEHV
jgi:hypothetical protein